jgi:hypothetical protein
LAPEHNLPALLKMGFIHGNEKMKKFITSIGDQEGPTIEACDFSHARQLAAEMDLDLVVDGELKLTLQCSSMTSEKADKLLRNLAESYDWDGDT